jgi:transcriptional regulator with XRE-family HTH domain
LTVGERISAAMKRLGLTAAQVAERMGVSTSAVNHWRADRYAVSPKYVLRLAEVLKLEPFEFSPYGTAPTPPDQDGNTNAYLRRLDNIVSRMAEDIGQLKSWVASLESRFSSLETAVHHRLDTIQKQIDNIGARARLDGRRDAPGNRRE